MSEGKKLISLKEAAQISGYSADYIGQLIRSGKIAGRQVYCNVAWMTTSDAVLNYKNQGEAKNEKGKSSFKSLIGTKVRKFNMSLSVIKLFFSTFRSALPITIVIFLSFVLLNIFIIYSMNQAQQVSANSGGKKIDQPLAY